VSQSQKRWHRLDNAAKIFPASMRRGWSNVFRISFTLTSPVCPEALKRAVARIAPRFPSVCVRLRRGLFWYYLEENAAPPAVVEEGCQPLLPMTARDVAKCALRVLYFENRIAVEFFHALTDGTGALSFVKTLAAAYLEETGMPVRYEGILSPEDGPDPAETEDSFLRHAGPAADKRDPDPAFRLTGTPEPDGFLHVTCATMNAADLLARARKEGISITALLSAFLVHSVAQIQKERVSPRRERAVRVQIAVNLRKYFESRSLRNFVSVFNVGVEKGDTDATLAELYPMVHHQMALQLQPRKLRRVFTANVNSEKGMAIRLVPLFLKNIVMRAVFDTVGERSATLCLSNLGVVSLPEEMERAIDRFDFIIGPQAKAPYNCAVVSYKGRLCINIVRNTREPALEQRFFPLLESEGVSITLESNER